MVLLGEIMKDNSISYLRVFSLLCIILCHFFQAYESKLAFWFNIGVQVFVFISGFLYGKKKIDNFDDFFKKRIKRVLIPYYIYLFFAFIYYFIFKPEYINFSLALKAIAGLQVFGDSINGLGHLWFVPVIMICYFLTPIIQTLYNNIKKYNDFHFLLIILFIVICLQLLLLFPHVGYEIPVNLSVYLIAYILSRRMMDKNISLKKLQFCLVIFIFIGISFSLIKIFVCDNAFFSNFGIIKYLNIITHYKCIFISISIFLLFYIFGKKTKLFLNTNKFIDFFDNYSYYIYLTHLIYILGPSSLINFSSYNLINYILIIILIIISSVVLKYICDIISKFLDW